MDGGKRFIVEHYDDCLCNSVTVAFFEGKVVKITGHWRYPWVIVAEKLEPVSSEKSNEF